MKINRDIRTGIEPAKNESSSGSRSQVRFGQLVGQQAQQMQTEEVARLLTEVTAAGDRLVRSRTMREFAKFRLLVQQVLKESTTYGFELKQGHTWNRYGEGKRLKTVKRVDEQLLELLDDLMNSEKSSLDLLEKIGEIKGMLINLYT